MKQNWFKRLMRWCGQPTREFGAAIGLFLLALIAVKVVELAGVAGRMELDHGFNLLIRALTYSLTIICWAVLAVWPLHLLLYRLSPKASRIVCALFFALWLLAEEGLILYCAHNGFLLSGAELFIRPFGETWLAVVSVTGPVWPIVGVAAWLALFTMAACWLARRPWKSHWVSLILLGVMLLLSLVLKPDNLRIVRYDNYIVNKTHSFCADLLNYWKSSDGMRSSQGREEIPEYDEVLVDAFLAIHPDFYPADKHYPLERPDATPDNLSPYFAAAAQPPHVVLLVVESMGEEYMRTGVMPFVDSLSRQSLYWPNCLSTTPRSYGAVSALTGSVGGPCGFQFGRMPNHNSMISILRHAGYHTGAYYAGSFAFDGVYDYLNAQRIDYLSPFFDEYAQREDKELDGCYWGYHDEALLARTVEEMAHQPAGPRFDMVITLTMHEPLALSDSKRQAAIVDRVHRLAGRLPAEERAWVGRHDRICASALYTDDALRQFFRSYMRLPGAENTIFVITGDHASGKWGETPLSYHHVPLLIWSPLLTEAHRFPAVVTHNDVAPSVCRLLSSRYGVEMPATVHWLGTGLDTSSEEHCDRRMLIVNYAHEMHEMLCGEYYYREATSGSAERLYTVGPGLSMREVKDSEACRRCNAELKAYQYIYKYTYRANCLTSYPLYESHQYAVYRHFEVQKPIAVTAPDRNPGGPMYEEQQVLPLTKMDESSQFDVVRLTLSADVSISRKANINAYPSLYITGWSDGNIGESINPVQYIQSDEVMPDSRYHITIEKEYPLDKDGGSYLQVSFCSPINDYGWEAGVGATLYNVGVLLEYGK